MSLGAPAEAAARTPDVALAGLALRETRSNSRFNKHHSRSDNGTA
jgi:hypothetical protein